jgi:hypothetical protein
LPVEFLLAALEDLEDLPAIARQLTALAPEGRVACGQSDPDLRELTLREGHREKRLIYRCEPDQILVLSAEHVAPTQH